MRSRAVLVSVVLLLAAFVPVSNAAELANSVADFSGTQGQNGWTYEVLNNGAYYDMTYNAGTSEWTLDTTYSGVTVTMKQNATQMMKDKIGGGTMQGVGTVRRWTTDSAITDVVVTGTYDVGYALTRIYHIEEDGTSHYIGQPTAGGPASGSYSFSIPNVETGDSIYMYMFCYGEAADNPYDSVYQDLNMTITGETESDPDPDPDPEFIPDVFNSVIDFSGIQDGNCWSYELDNNGAISDMVWDGGASEWVGTGTYAGAPFTLKINATSQMEAKIGGGATQGPGTRRVWTAPAEMGDVIVSGAYNITASDARVQLFRYDASTGITSHFSDLLNGIGSGTYSKLVPDIDAGDAIIMKLGAWTDIAANEVYMAWDMTVTRINRRKPFYGATKVPVNLTFKWFPGSEAISTNLYFGTDFNDVNDATASFLTGDVDSDGQINFSDVLVAAQQWLTDPDGEDPSANLNTDDIVNTADFAIIAKDWKERSIYVGNFDPASSTYPISGLELYKRYYWRIDEVRPGGTVKGAVWHFTTGIPTELEVAVGVPFIITSITHDEIDEFADPDYIATYGYWGFWTHPHFRKCADGSLLLSYGAGGDLSIPEPNRESLLRSYDNGETWVMDPMAELRPLSPRVRESYLYFNGVDPNFGMGLLGFCNLSDGNSITYDFAKKDASGGPEDFLTTMWRSSDGGATWSEPTDVNVTIPNMNQNSSGTGAHMWFRSVELSNGNLVVTAHTGFVGDLKSRVITLESSDKGYSWHYLGTVAYYDPAVPVLEGYNEPIICKLAGDELICLIRTGSSQPMYQAHSSDGGATWTTPIQAGVEGVAPDMRMLSSGILACRYGRPGNNVMFSIDGTGNNWTNHTAVFDGSSSGYSAIEEVYPGRLLYVYDQIGYAGNTANAILGVYIDVDYVY